MRGGLFLVGGIGGLVCEGGRCGLGVREVGDGRGVGLLRLGGFGR